MSTGRILLTILALVGASVTGCDEADREQRARDAAEQMKESIPDVHAAALAQKVSKEEVERAQRALTAEKEYMGPVTGELDRVTVNAIQAFQRKQGLEDDGILDDRTMTLLEESLAAAD